MARAYYGKELKRLIAQMARRHNLDPKALLAVATVEGGFHGASGDNGSSFGPFQLHVGGALPSGASREWANTRAGVSYAVRRIAAVAKGQTGRNAVSSIVYNFERPAAPGAEVERAMGVYGKGGVGASSGRVRYGGYVDPYAHLTRGRVDQGIDFSGSGWVGAIGKAKVVRAQRSGSGWPGIGGFIVYKLLEGPMKGHYVYVGEDLRVRVRVGQVVRAGQKIGFATGGGSGIETGFSDAHGTPLSHSWYVTQPDGTPTKGGYAFGHFLSHISDGSFPGGGAPPTGGPSPSPPGTPSPVGESSPLGHNFAPLDLNVPLPGGFEALPGQAAGYTAAPGTGAQASQVVGQAMPAMDASQNWAMLAAQPGSSLETQSFAQRARLYPALAGPQ